MSNPQTPESLTASASPLASWLLRLLPLAVIVGALAVVYAMGWHRGLSLETLVGNRAGIDAFVTDHRAVAVLAFIALYAAATMGAIPAGAVLAVVGGLLFGTAVGGLSAMVGSTIGATTLYLVGRGAFGPVLARGRSPMLRAFAAGFRADAFSYVLFLRLMPTPSWLTSLGAGSLHVRPATFVAATALGRTPGSFVFALFGAGLAGVIDTQEALYRACLAAGGADCRVDFDPAKVLTPTLLAALVGLGLLALVPVVAKRFLLNRPAAPAVAQD
jgi:uncharacterized membrane protein YdjX (TVP38/TMEM64 family)